MAFPLTFLSANLPLTKTIERLADGSIHKSSYPLVGIFTSETVEIRNLIEFHAAVVKRARDPKKPCLLKGTITKPLVCESRKNSTSTNDKTQWICLDVDEARFTSPDEVMRAIGLEDVSYVVQYSSSYKLDGNNKLSCHIFVVLNKEIAAPQLKAWLMHLNQSVSALENDISLSSNGAALHWPLDISTCQNDKLLYIANPIFKGVPLPFPEEDRIQLVKRKREELDIKRLEIKPIEQLKQVQRDKLNTLRTGAGFKPLKSKPRMIGEHEVQGGVGEIAVYEVIDCGEFNRLNLNGGNSQAYWHYKSDPTLLHNFKGEPSLLIKEILPHYYADLVRNMKTADLAPTQDGATLLAFRDKVTASYWKGSWTPAEHKLELHGVKSELQLDHFLQSHGATLGAFVPEYHMVFDPQNPEIVNTKDKVINTFVPTEFMRLGKANKKGETPLIDRIITSIIGTDEALVEHFMNWLAVVWQQKRKPMTAWVLHGDEGTGKGLLFHKILRPLFGVNHTAFKKASELSSQFNPWLEQALIGFIDEIDADMFVNSKVVEADIKTMITEPTLPIRRMRTDAYEVPNFTAFIFSSNKKKPVAIPPGDRRFNIGQYQPHKLQITPSEVDKLVDELPAFAYYLSTRKADFNASRLIMQTDDRLEIQKMSITSVDALARILIDGNLMALWETMPDEKLLEEVGLVAPVAKAYASIVRRISYEAVSDLTKDELSVIFTHNIGKVPEGLKFATFLRHHGIVIKRLRINNHLGYGFRVNWQVLPEDKEILMELLDPKYKQKVVKLAEKRAAK